MVDSAVFHNRTRRSRSIPWALTRRGQLPAVPLYYVLRLSDLAREGFENSGSYRFADHIYKATPSGRGPLGRWIDQRLLAMPAVRSFRNRFLATRDALVTFVLASDSSRDINVLSVPSGIPRELIEAATILRERGRSLDRVHFHALDLDPRVLEEARQFAAHHKVALTTHHGDALAEHAYPKPLSFVTCTGLGEFLGDDALVQLYRNIAASLEPGGMFVTTGMQRRPIADYLLRLAELSVHYRNGHDLGELARRGGFTTFATRIDEYGIQTILTCRR